jgi:glycosyltransferase involved in cell wall biosynthesis
LLVNELGFRAPSPAELSLTLARRAKAWIGGRTKGEPVRAVPATVLHGDPLISYSGIVPRAPIGLAGLMPATQRPRPSWFLLSPTWSIEEETAVLAIRRRAVVHRLTHPGHRLIFMCNAPGEAALLRRHGEAAFVHNKTSTVSESIFRPLTGVPLEFDAIYNAQLAPWKRHELSLAIERCAFLFYRDLLDSSTREIEADVIARHAALAPGHVFLNPFGEDGRPVRFDPHKVNRQLNRAAVGLCLSEVEGAMFASTEYLLAGLAIVSTPNRGGRSAYFDGEFCLTVPPDPRSVAEAVRALKDRNIPRDYIRQRTLKRIDGDRKRFGDLLNAILEESASGDRMQIPWAATRPVLMEWLPPATAIDRAIKGIPDDLSERKPEADRESGTPS